jgi:hypothetical protein
MTYFAAPSNYHVFHRHVDGRWGRVQRQTALRIRSYPELPLDQSQWDLERIYGISDRAVEIELFRINGGSAGYYLADLATRRYWYCGLEYPAVKDQIRALGVAIG